MAVYWQPQGSDPLSEFVSEQPAPTPRGHEIAGAPAPRAPRPTAIRPDDTVDETIVIALATLAGIAAYAVFLLTR